jgi:hypothetical protein
MFRILIKWVIQALDALISELKRAYSETYELSDLTKEFTAKVKEIRKKNKQRFLKAAETFELNKGIFSLEFPTYKQVQERAKMQWNDALRKGDLDELYNIKEREQ